MLKVAVGVVKNERGEVLVTKRAHDVPQGGLWEFPGGKLELGEDSKQALRRELLEELNITVLTATRLIQIKHDYSELSVCLDVYIVDSFKGDVCAMEGQPTRWVVTSDLERSSFPVANLTIIEALNLPRYYPIIDDSIGNEQAMLSHLERLIDCGHTLFQLRAKSFSKERYKGLAEEAIKMCKEKGARLFVNAPIEDALEIGAEGVHLTASDMSGIKNKSTLPEGLLFAASCHNQEELQMASDLGVLFAVLSPVCKTQTHVDVEPLGWGEFERLADHAWLPVFALGGLGPEDINQAQSKGAMGVAGIRAF
jgi:8-oxo-dGTP diphosphatase